MRSRIPPLTLLWVCLLASSARAQDPQMNRCNNDALTNDQAIARAEWARRCGLMRNTGGASSWFTTNAAFDTTFAWAKEYREADTSHAYTGNTHYNNVNYYHARSLYDATPMYSVYQETSGTTAGYWRWSHTTARAKALYPTFESTTVAGSGTPLYPHPTNANDCRLYSNMNGTTPWVTTTRYTVCDDLPVEALDESREPGGDLPLRDPIIQGCRIITLTEDKPFYVAAYCESNCHDGAQGLMLASHEDTGASGHAELAMLSPEATLESPAPRLRSEVGDATALRGVEHMFYEFQMASGEVLRVAPDQPVLTSEGRLVKPESLLLGDALQRGDGTPDRIVTVKQTLQSATVYDLRPESRDSVSDLLLSQGYLLGLSRPPSEDVQQLNRVLRQRGIPEEVLPE